MKLKVFLLLLLINSYLTAQVVFENAEQASSFAVSKSQTYTLLKLNAIMSLKAANLAIQEFLPQFDVSWTESDNVKINGADSRNKTFNMNMQLNVFDCGKRSITYKMNKAEKTNNLYSVDIVTKTFKSDVINQYYTCLLAEKMLDIKRELERNSKTQLDILEKEADLGLALKNDYLEYLISYRKIQDSVRFAERDLRTQYRVFKVVLGLEPEAEIILKEDILVFDDSVYLEPYLSILWPILKSRNLELKQQRNTIYYTQLQNKLNKHLFIPDVSLQGGISFSGTEYPLNNPTYKAKLVFNFSNNPYLPLSISKDVGFNDKGKLTSSTNSASSAVIPKLNYRATIQLKDIELQQKREEMKDTINSLYENLFEQIAAYDDSIDSIKRTRETIELHEKRLAISEKQVEKGFLKKIDYLEQLVEMAEDKILLIESIAAFHALTRSLEIALNIPFGGLKNCLDIE